MSNGDSEDSSPNEGGMSPTGNGRIQQLDIQDEMRNSYLTYAMSVIISRALPDARDGLKPSQRRILVAMNDLNLGPNTARIKCAKITGDTSGNYHPHGSEGLYPTLVRLAQDWVMRSVLVDKQGNFGSLAGLPPAAQRYTEARLSAVASEMLQDLNRDTVDFVPTYDQRMTEPVVLPGRFPNLLVNGSTGIAVGMATSVPPHNLGEVCDAVMLLIDNPDCTVDEILDVLPGPDFPTGGTICGRYGIRQAYITGRSTITLRARTHFETEGKSRRDRRHRDSLSRNPRPHPRETGTARQGRTGQRHCPRDRLHRPQSSLLASSAAHRAQTRCRQRSGAQPAFRGIRLCKPR